MKRVLIISDKNDLLKEIEEAIVPELFEANYSHNKNDGVEIAYRYLPDIIVFIYSVPSDMLYIKKIKDHPSAALTPIIVFSNNPSFDEQRLIMNEGVDDYIPAGFAGNSLIKSIECRINRINAVKEKINEQLDSFEGVKTAPKLNDHMIVKIGRKVKLIKFSDIIIITALKEYSRITTADKTEVLVRKSMRSWTKILPSENFLRIHRATIINLSFIDNIMQTSPRIYTVSIKGVEEKFNFSYRYANIMRRTFPT